MQFLSSYSVEYASLRGLDASAGKDYPLNFVVPCKILLLLFLYYFTFEILTHIYRPLLILRCLSFSTTLHQPINISCNPISKSFLQCHAYSIICIQTVPREN